jgi:hypothetical protein
MVLAHDGFKCLAEEAVRDTIAARCSQAPVLVQSKVLAVPGPNLHSAGPSCVSSCWGFHGYKGCAFCAQA